MTDDTVDLQLGRERIAQVFQYLKALNEHRNPAQRQISNQPWSMWLDDLPDHPTLSLGSRRAAATIVVEGETKDDAKDAPILRVRRPRLTNPPSPPELISPWLRAGWDDPTNQPRCVESHNEVDESGRAFITRFDDDPARLELLRAWRQQHEEWRVNELPAREAMRVFASLYELYGRIERDSERLDLVLGDGILSWRQDEEDEENVYHPVLIQRVQLLFDPQGPEFTVVETDFGVELYTSLFQSIPDVDGQSLAQCRDDFEKAPCHPLADEAAAFLNRFVVTLSAQGEFTDRGRPTPSSVHPVIGRSPVLFLRPRTLGFSNAIQRVLDNVKTRNDFCSGLLNIIGVETMPADHVGPIESEVSSTTSLSSQEILFAKEANPEQLQIAERLDRHGAVLVQGPPGTGKSHTIANLIGHLLAHQQTVLVTSHTTKALRVLREHVVPALRPLCVSVLESDLDSRKQLEDAVLGISSRLSNSDAESLEREAGHFWRARQHLVAEIDRLRTDLLNARTNEYRDIVVAGRACSPAQAARTVAAGKRLHDWIPGPIAADYPLPLSHGELIDLYATNAITTSNDDSHISSPFPELTRLPTPKQFREAAVLSELDPKDKCDRFDELWTSMQFKTWHVTELENLAERWRRAIEELSRMEPWRRAAVDAGRQETADRDPWFHLLGKIEETCRLASDFQLDRIQHKPELAADWANEEQNHVAASIRKHFALGGRMSWLTLARNPLWKRAIHAWRVGGRQPRELLHFTAIEKCLNLTIARGELAILWDGLLGRRGLAKFAEMWPDPETSCAQVSTIIGDALEWWARNWSPLVDQLQQFGFDWGKFLTRQPPSFEEHAGMARIVQAVDNELLGILTGMARRLKARHMQNQLRQIASTLLPNGWPEVCDLRRAIDERDAEGYDAAHARLLAAAMRREHLIRRHELLERLEGTPEGELAEAWASRIRNRIGIHGARKVPGDPNLAWEWRQLHDELDRRSQVDVETLCEEIEVLRRRLEACTGELIDCRAWAGQVRRTSLAQRQALEGWLALIRRIGRGYSKRDAQLRAEARRTMSACSDAVPVWIMPIARLVESFDFAKPQFDVVIIDEASQCDVMSLLALVIAKKVVIVGDHEQVSPSAIGQKLVQVQQLIETHLMGIPNSALYDGQMSVYDLARMSFGGTIRLLEHFRCVPDIIQFSNSLSYGDIKPLRDEASSALLPHVVPYRVQASVREDKVNSEEALAVASLIAAMLEDRMYDGKTLGVISLVGEEQALEINRLLLTHLSLGDLKARRILCGNAAQFQGDERDVVLLSVVDTPKGAPLPLRQQPMFQQRFNVAASRARDQMWVVYSVSPEADLKPGDLRRRLIEHALDPKAVSREIEKAGCRVESEFERQVMERLVQRRFRVTPQWKVGQYRIDLVVEGEGKRLAVECDGDRYHPIEKLGEDMDRQAILERLGWKFVRLRGSAFFRDPDATMQRVFERLEKLGILPDAHGQRSEASEEVCASETVSSVIRRAAEIRAEWERGEQGADKAPASATSSASQPDDPAVVAGDSIPVAPGAAEPQGRIGISKPADEALDGAAAPAKAGSVSTTAQRIATDQVKATSEQGSPLAGKQDGSGPDHKPGPTGAALAIPLTSPPAQMRLPIDDPPKVLCPKCRKPMVRKPNPVDKTRSYLHCNHCKHNMG